MLSGNRHNIVQMTAEFSIHFCHEPESKLMDGIRVKCPFTDSSLDADLSRYALL